MSDTGEGHRCRCSVQGSSVLPDAAAYCGAVLAPSRDQAPVTDFLSSTPLTAFRRALARVLALLVGFGPLAAHAQAAGTAAVKPLVATVATPSASRPNVTLRWTRLGNPRSPSLLQVPADCQVRSCPLVVVSHPRAQDAASGDGR